MVVRKPPDKISKIPARNFFGINMRSLFAKFQLPSFKIEGGVRGDRLTEDMPLPFGAGGKIYLGKISKLTCGG